MSETSQPSSSSPSWPRKGSSPAISLPQETIRLIRAELERRRIAELASTELAKLQVRCRSSFLEFCRQALKADGFAPAAHHRLLIDKLQVIAEGKLLRLMVLMPPGSAKSTYATVLYSAWRMARRTNIIGASHTVELAQEFSSSIQQRVRENEQILGYQLRNSNVRRWFTTNRSAYLAAGAGSGIAGFRADLAIIDDPIKGRLAADSERRRDAVWKWFLGDLERRLRVGGAIVLIQTRWHEDDLAGRLEQIEGKSWDVLRLPGMCDDPDHDPLGRKLGEPLWADDGYGFGNELTSIRNRLERAGAVREWSAQYQQQPTPAEGTIFKPGRMNAVDANDVPRGIEWVRAWDLAATRETGTLDPDYTAGVKLGRTVEGRHVIGDIRRFRGSPEEVEREIKATAEIDGFGVRIGIPQDPGQSGKAQSEYLVRQLNGFIVETSRESGDKTTRAMPIASQLNAGNVAMIRGEWNGPFISELASFPSGSHDDQVDALSRAAMMLDTEGLSVWMRAAGMS